jgi:mRNA interferase RelE/StbE
MRVEIEESFVKDTKKVKDKKVLSKLADTIEHLSTITKLSDIPNCKKLKGSSTAYRIRIGDYRAGFFYENGTIYFSRFIHRKEIYSMFP